MADAPDTPARRAWLVWGAALLAYLVAVTHRTSFGVAGLTAAGRFGVQQTVLSLFVVVQVFMYAALQLPVGVALDRWGSRRVLTLGAVVAGAGQLGMVLAGSVPAALAARVLIGSGDAMTFVSAIRLIPAWFPLRRVPLLTQLTGIVGGLGQVVSAVPFAWVLHHDGWVPAFGLLAGLGALAALAAWCGVVDRPAWAPPVVRRPLLTGLSATLRAPGTWLGFWSHLVSAFSVQVFTLMWGYPFLVEGQGLSAGTASAMLTWSVVVTVVAGPVIGVLTARWRQQRSTLVLGNAVLTLAGWLVVLVPTTPRPLWQIVVFVALVSVGGPGSIIGLDLAASFSPPERMGAATGVANTGGFLGGLSLTLAVGVVLDHRGTRTPGLADCRAALSLAFVVWAIGVAGVVVNRVRTRRLLSPADHPAVT